MHSFRLHKLRLWLVLVALLFPAVVQAQQSDPDWGTERVWTTNLDVTTNTDSSAPARPRTNRIQLFRIVPAFLTDPIGLESDDPKDATPDDGPDWLQVSMGNYNPFFDFRRPGDPGGVGYYKMHTQVQLFDTGSTGLTLAMQAVTPAGIEQDGVQDGPTVVSPSLCAFHTLDDGTGFQGYFGRNMDVERSSITGRLQRNIQYGVSVQKPVLDSSVEKFGSFYVFVEALGRYRYDESAAGPLAVWEMVPGVHWRMTDNMWLTAGVLLPVNAPTGNDTHLWQLTCSFQF